ncbi:MAG: cytochrome c oxidase subunit 3 [Taibaiella sp.]|nr:cytochrome c oxidase subunit 3 [Taibaiella sp.]
MGLGKNKVRNTSLSFGEGRGEVSMERRKIHPQKFMMWVAMGSMAMAFAGLTSGYLVRQAQGNWRYYDLPMLFWYSTVAIIISSVTMHFGVRAFKSREMPRYKALITTTLVLGILFGIFQYAGFYQLYHQLQQIRINGETLNQSATVRLNGNPSESFLFIIAGLHLLHLAGGLIGLTIVFFRAFRVNVKVYNATGLEIAATYWHFVDILWVYLFVFFLANQ